MTDSAWLYDPAFWEIFAQQIPLWNDRRKAELIAQLSERTHVPADRIEKQLRTHWRVVALDLDLKAPLSASLN